MPGSQQMNKNMNDQDNKPSPEASNPTAEDPEKSNIAEAQDRDFKIAIRNMFNDLKKDLNKSLNEVHENNS